MSVTILTGDCRKVLRDIPSESVQCCVTSPPYWGLRDYGHADQIGQEATPELFVESMVAVFEEVRRVLRADGTLWLNLGSSYFSNPGNGRGGGSTLSGGTPHLSGSQRVASGGTNPIQSRPSMRAPACGSDDRALQDLQAPDSACYDLCDECRAALSMGSDCTSLPPEQSPPLIETKARDNEHLGCEKVTADASLPFVQASTIPESSSQRQEDCRHCANCGACLSVLRSSTRDARLCARRVLCRNGTGWRASDSYTSDKDVLGLAYPSLSTPSLNFKPKDLVNIPAMVAEALRSAGWWLRSEIIWHKPNPMPESVTDRPTSAHEKLFLFAKSATYYYDAGAIREPASPSLIKQVEEGYRGEAVKDYLAASVQDASATKARIIGNARKRIDKQRGHGRRHAGFNDKWDALTPAEQSLLGSNKRNVWTIATANYREAHFATFPPDLVKPCVLAGCPAGGTIIDPFGGSGTVGMVAEELGRNSILIELNQSYIPLIRERTNVTPGLALA